MKARVFITLKSGVLDPQGKAIGNALKGLGFDGVGDVRQGKLIELELSETDPAAANADYSQINQKIMEGAYYLPIVSAKALNYRNPRLTNVYYHNAFGQIDFQALGVSDGK